MEDPIEEKAKKSKNGTILAKQRHRLGSNCVFFARSKEPSIPQGMSTLYGKERIINTHQPQKNAVAITKEGPVGHLAIVTAVLDDSIVIEEGNFVHGYMTVRKVSRELPVGYYVAN